jgi:hypothetical protein
VNHDALAARGHPESSDKIGILAPFTSELEQHVPNAALTPGTRCAQRNHSSPDTDRR